MKFSIIVPVYNVEKYVLKCLQSINEQSYQNYEVIIIDDGSKDNSKEIIKEFIKGKEKFKYYKKANGGLADARNYGLKYVTGDYILFIDSDDYISKDLLKNLNDYLVDRQVSVLRFGINVVDSSYNIINKPENVKDSINKLEIIKDILHNEFVEVSWAYAYNKVFWQEHNFKFAKGTIHEDYGLTLIILSKSESIGAIDYNGYNYVQRENSIMSSTNYEKIQKRVNDFKFHFINHRQEIKNNTIENKLILSYSAEALIYKTRELKDNDFKEMINYIKKAKVINQIYGSSFKKVLFKIYLFLFLKPYLIKLRNEFYCSLGDNNG